MIRPSAPGPTPTTVWETVPCPSGITPADIFAPAARRPYAQLLDWQKSGGTTYLLMDPAETVEITMGDLDAASPGNAFATLEQTLAQWGHAAGYVPGNAPAAFTGGAAGLFAYELAHDLEQLPKKNIPTASEPVLSAGLYDTIAALPAASNEFLLISPWDTPQTRAKRDRLRQMIETAVPAPTPSAVVCDAPQPDMRPADYRAAVARIIELIHAGDIFQANLAQRFTTPMPDELAAFDIYRRLAGITPPPFAAHLTLPDRTLISSSPERFLQVTASGEVRTEPIKGTRPRGTTQTEDAQFAVDLLASEKDRAENVMIVDLLRNDLSRVCADHSVKVEDLCELHTFANVHHLISTVTGQLRPDATALSCLAACFPGGSITGAPKVRAMQIINDEEPCTRGAYCGAIGFVGLDGAMDTSIAIRTLTIKDGTVSYHAGGGIVADSDPDAEYDETITKASAIRAALCGDSGGQT